MVKVRRGENEKTKNSRSDKATKDHSSSYFWADVRQTNEEFDLLVISVILFVLFFGSLCVGQEKSKHKSKKNVQVERIYTLHWKQQHHKKNKNVSCFRIYASMRIMDVHLISLQKHI